MPYRVSQFSNNEIYHIVTRGINDQIIFKDADDYYRAIFSIYEFNNSYPVDIYKRRRERGGERVSPEADERDKLVDILGFCLMPTHPHLLLKQLKDEGITKFMLKFGAGYGGYFNRKYNRKGYVFQNRFKNIHIKDDTQLKTVFAYIHANPISLIEPKWKELGIKNPAKASKFLENYKWSSYSDYIGKKNFPSITERKFLSEIIGGSRECENFLEDWINYKSEARESAELALE